ncbi:MAG: Flagellar hook-associated protein FlgK [Labilithrix sp.]|nr:Flagellar hook-associated protein FlgK [Labilithrix sp.]
MSLSGLLNIARSGLMAQTGALTITGQNVTNATTVGYSKRVAGMQSQVGGGVVFTGEVRNFDKFAFSAMVDQGGKRASADARATALVTVEGIIAPPSQTIGDRATSLMGAFTTLTAYPTDAAVRSDVLAKVDALAGSISSASQALTDTSKELLAKSRGVVSEVNGQLTKIATLNGQIAASKAQGIDASTLRDQRDGLVKDVGERLGARSIEDPQGRITLFSAGAVLVEGDRTSPLALDLDAGGKMRVTVQGASTIDITSRVTDGSLGGLREARDVDLAKAVTDLDAYAFDVGNTINAAHAAGYGTDGVTGRNLFSVSATQVGAAASFAIDPAVKDNPKAVGAAGSVAELPGGNTGATRLALLADTEAFGGATIANRYASLAGDVGQRKASAESDRSMRDDTLALATSVAENASGVSLDEEMVDMSRYQRAFEAASKVLQTADSLLENFLRDV